MVQKINRRQAKVSAANQQTQRAQKLLSSRGVTEKKIDQSKPSSYNEVYFNEDDTGQTNPLQRTVDNTKEVGIMGPMTGAQGAGALDDLAKVASRPLMQGNASQAGQMGVGTTPAGMTTDEKNQNALNLGTDPRARAVNNQSAGFMSTVGTQIRNFADQRTTERLTQGDPTTKRAQAITAQKLREYQQGLSQEAQTDEYKQAAFANEGFIGDGTDQFNEEIRSAYMAGGIGNALRVARRLASAEFVGGSEKAQADRLEQMMAEVDRIEKYDQITKGTYVSDADKQVMTDLEAQAAEQAQVASDQSARLQAQQAANRAEGFATFDSAIAEVQSNVDVLEAMKESNPEIYAMYLPVINNLKKQQFDALQEKIQLDNASYDPSDYIETLEDRADALGTEKRQSLQLVQRSADLKIQAAKEVKAAREAELAIKKINDTEAQTLKVEENVKNEAMNRRLANRFGIESDTAGLRWMQESVNKGSRELANMKSVADIQNSSLVAQITSEYYTNIESALIDHDAKSLEIKSIFRKENNQIEDIINSTKQQDAADTQLRIKEYWAKQNKIDTDTANTLSSAHQSLFNERIRLQEKQDQSINENFARLMQLSSTYGSKNPGAMQGVIDELTKLGVDMSRFDVTAPTLTELGQIATAANAAQSTMSERVGSRIESYTDQYGFDLGYAMQSLAGGDFTNNQLISQLNRMEMVAGLPDDNLQKRVTLLDVARDGLEKNEREKLTNSATIQERLVDTLALIEKYKGTGVWNKFIQDQKKWADLPKDSELLQIQSNLGWITTQTTKDFFGANFTAGEMGRADTFLPNLTKGQNVKDLEGILKGWQEQINIESMNGLDNRFGSGGGARKLVGDDNLFELLSGSGGAQSTNWDKLNNIGLYDTLDNFLEENGIDDGDISSQMDAYGGIPGVNMTDFSQGDPVSTLDKYNKGTYNPPPVQQTAYSPYISAPVIVTGYGSAAWGNGVDVYAKKGTPVKSPLKGKVIEVKNSYVNNTNTPDSKYALGSKNETFGNLAKVKFDNGFVGQFAHLASVYLKEGMEIQPGSTIGPIGNTGTTYGSTGVHLDFTLWDSKGRLLSAKEAAAFLQLTQTT